jgi:hypothetical protein
LSFLKYGENGARFRGLSTTGDYGITHQFNSINEFREKINSDPQYSYLSSVPASVLNNAFADDGSLFVIAINPEFISLQSEASFLGNEIQLYNSRSTLSENEKLMFRLSEKGFAHWTNPDNMSLLLYEGTLTTVHEINAHARRTLLGKDESSSLDHSWYYNRSVPNDYQPNTYTILTDPSYWNSEAYKDAIQTARDLGVEEILQSEIEK